MCLGGIGFAPKSVLECQRSHKVLKEIISKSNANTHTYICIYIYIYSFLIIFRFILDLLYYSELSRIFRKFILQVL